MISKIFYKSDISDRTWIICDILGNIGWITYGVGFVWFIMNNYNILLENVWMLIFTLLECICTICIIAGLIELINERINKLDRLLTRRRLFRGFGCITYSSLLAMFVIAFQSYRNVILNVNANSGNFPLFLMTIGAVLCFVFCQLIFIKYKKCN